MNPLGWVFFIYTPKNKKSNVVFCCVNIFEIIKKIKKITTVYI